MIDENFKEDIAVKFVELKKQHRKEVLNLMNVEKVLRKLLNLMYKNPKIFPNIGSELMDLYKDLDGEICNHPTHFIGSMDDHECKKRGL